MRALLPKQRAFVYALVETGGNQSQAAYAAGYGEESPNEEKRKAACRVRGHQLASDTKVLEAIKEEAQKRLNSAAMIAASALLEIVLDPQHKSRLRAIEVLLDRSGLVVEQKLNVHHTHSSSNEDLIEKTIKLAALLNVDARPLLKRAGVAEDVIDAHFTVVPTPTAAGLEDLLA